MKFPLSFLLSLALLPAAQAQDNLLETTCPTEAAALQACVTTECPAICVDLEVNQDTSGLDLSDENALAAFVCGAVQQGTCDLAACCAPDKCVAESIAVKDCVHTALSITSNCDVTDCSNVDPYVPPDDTDGDGEICEAEGAAAEACVSSKCASCETDFEAEVDPPADFNPLDPDSLAEYTKLICDAVGDIYSEVCDCCPACQKEINTALECNKQDETFASCTDITCKATGDSSAAVFKSTATVIAATVGALLFVWA